ncbi:TIGR03618 family F420-dependent PPOX class oxidoreductase [Paractinoplanes globisporus]|uniref:TIGR03618 family F420-dependent PPOX class oxidoreductase n=1 Tax=Paractinoplanes globisporus TaxID=113565 RepID=A0ABW6W650_9ACTN|nr:TIGR03618 family F420-dependent PPOX class oxidoreductase [Actinoplanes globisporus]
MATTLAEAWELSRSDRGLAIVSTLRADQTIQTSLVNTGVVGDQLAFVTYGPVKLANLRARPQIAVAFRDGWRWAAVEGRAELAGPDDPRPGLDAEGLRLLLREIFTAAGGTHDNWDEYDRTMRDQRRAAVLITPTRVYGS